MKNTVQLTESQLKALIAESVRNVLNEIGDTEEGQRAMGKLWGRKLDRKPGDQKSLKALDRYAARQAKKHKLKGYEKITRDGMFGDSFSQGIDDWEVENW